MKVGIITIFAALLLALPALAGTEECAGTDTDGDGTNDVCDNCSSLYNASQTDGDQDGYGDACDCDFSGSANNFCDGADFSAFASNFNTSAAGPGTKCEYDMAQPANAFIDGADFSAFAAVFNTTPGPACGNAPGTPCVDPGAVCP
jgi:hypothetical protein